MCRQCGKRLLDTRDASTSLKMKSRVCFRSSKWAQRLSTCRALRISLRGVMRQLSFRLSSFVSLSWNSSHSGAWNTLSSKLEQLEHNGSPQVAHRDPSTGIKHSRQDTEAADFGPKTKGDSLMTISPALMLAVAKRPRPLALSLSRTSTLCRDICHVRLLPFNEKVQSCHKLFLTLKWSFSKALMRIAPKAARHVLSHLTEDNLTSNEWWSNANLEKTKRDLRRRSSLNCVHNDDCGHADEGESWERH